MTGTAVYRVTGASGSVTVRAFSATDALAAARALGVEGVDAEQIAPPAPLQCPRYAERGGRCWLPAGHDGECKA